MRFGRLTPAPGTAAQSGAQSSTALRRAAGRLAAGAWPILQGAVAATIAWVLAKHVFGHPQPFFAPVAAVIALNTTVGERGLHAVRLLYGVLVGILIGEAILATLGDGYLALGLATFLAMAVALFLGGARITVAQAAVGAILTIAVARPEAGVNRLADALIGIGVALIFSQVLFSPEPLRLIRRAEAAALRGLAEGLDLTCRALVDDDERVAGLAIERLRDLRDELTELSRMRRASARVARRSLVWRQRAAPVVRENENAAHLDLLGASCLMLARTSITVSPTEREPLVANVPLLAAALREMADDPGDRDRRQRAADHALAVARALGTAHSDVDSARTAAVIAARAVAIDTMTFAGVDPEQAIAAAGDDTGVLEVSSPPQEVRSPLRPRR